MPELLLAVPHRPLLIEESHDQSVSVDAQPFPLEQHLSDGVAVDFEGDLVVPGIELKYIRFHRIHPHPQHRRFRMVSLGYQGHTVRIRTAFEHAVAGLKRNIDMLYRPAVLRQYPHAGSDSLAWSAVQQAKRLLLFSRANENLRTV